MLRSFFAYLNDPKLDNNFIAIGGLAIHSGKRPSEIFHWNNKEDWFERLIFDIVILNRTLEKMYGKEEVGKKIVGW